MDAERKESLFFADNQNVSLFGFSVVLLSCTFLLSPAHFKAGCCSGFSFTAVGYLHYKKGELQQH